jgi:hypothetical protein
LPVFERLTRAETLAGLLFAAFGAAAIWLASDYPYGTPTRMGAGFVPIGLGWWLVGLGGAIAAAGFVPHAAQKLPQSDARPLLFLLLGVAAFAVLLERGGLVAAIAACVGVARLAEQPYRWREVALLAGGLAVAGALIFVVGLGLPIPLVPR